MAQTPRSPTPSSKPSCPRLRLSTRRPRQFSASTRAAASSKRQRSRRRTLRCVQFFASTREKAVGSDHLSVLGNTWTIICPIPGFDHQRAQLRAVSSDVPHHGVRDPVALQSQMLKMRARREDRQHIVVAYWVPKP
eukprot:scaffold99951_cov63-Phaeocystis_antarctica.AAC.3